jgi:WD repeat-containing protein 48
VKNWSLKPNNEFLSAGKSAAKLSSENIPHHQTGAEHHGNSSTTNKHHSMLLTSSNTTAAHKSDLLHAAAATKSSSSSSSFSLSSSFLLQNPLNTHPLITIKGTSSIKQYTILNDKRYIVTKDTDENVCVWDVLQARKLESLGRENYESAIKVRQRFISVPNWFTVDLRLGVVTVSLDENDWQSAWINFKDMDSNHVRQSQYIDLSEAKVNYGYIFLESVFKSCLFLNPLRQETCTNVIISNAKTNANSSGASANGVGGSEDAGLKSGEENEEENVAAGLLRFNIPEHTTLIVSELGGRAMYRLEVRDLARETEQSPFANVLPSWIIDALLGVFNCL